MARVHGCESVYEVAEAFKFRCLAGRRSLLWPEHDCWNFENERVLWAAFNRIDFSNRSFLAKLHDNIADASDDLHRLAADLLSVYYLFPAGSVGYKRKLGDIRTISRWKIGEVPNEQFLQKAYSSPVGGTGMVYIGRRPEQLMFLLRFAGELARRDVDPHARNKCEDIANEIQKVIPYSTAARNVLLHLLFPDYYERIVSHRHKKWIVQKFGAFAPDAKDDDEALLMIRAALVEKTATTDFDFYDEGIREQWDPKINGVITDYLSSHLKPERGSKSVISDSLHRADEDLRVIWDWNIDPDDSDSDIAYPRRYITASVSEQGSAEVFRTAFRSQSKHLVTVQIGYQDPKVIIADGMLPEEELPPSETGHELTVVFSEPWLVFKPQVAQCHLPPRIGSSTTCVFAMETATSGSVEARIAVLYKNRILQTAMLRGDVVDNPSKHEGEISLKIEANLRPIMIGLDERNSFDAALILNHSADGESRMTTIAGAHAALVRLRGLRDVAREIDERLSASDWANSEFGGLYDHGTTDLLRFLALQGCTLYQALVEDNLIGDAIAKATRLQIVAREESHLPLEFVYDSPPPERCAPVCPKAVEALSVGSCCECTQEKAKVVCPLAFWGMNRVLEWHVFNPNLDADLSLSSDPIPGRNRLDILTSALTAASIRVESVANGMLDEFAAVLQHASDDHLSSVSSWQEWKTKVNETCPTLLVLFVHTLRDPADNRQACMQIGENDSLAVVRLTAEHVWMKKSQPPLVLLLGCETGAPDIPFQGFVAQFRRRGAAIVVSTTARILGRHAVPVAREFVLGLGQQRKDGAASFGDVVLDVKRKLLASGIAMVLCINAYGDADWRL